MITLPLRCEVAKRHAIYPSDNIAGSATPWIGFSERSDQLLGAMTMKQPPNKTARYTTVCVGHTEQSIGGLIEALNVHLSLRDEKITPELVECRSERFGDSFMEESVAGRQKGVNRFVRVEPPF